MRTSICVLIFQMMVIFYAVEKYSLKWAGICTVQRNTSGRKVNVCNERFKLRLLCNLFIIIFISTVISHPLIINVSPDNCFMEHCKHFRCDFWIRSHDMWLEEWSRSMVSKYLTLLSLTKKKKRNLFYFKKGKLEVSV